MPADAVKLVEDDVARPVVPNAVAALVVAKLLAPNVVEVTVAKAEEPRVEAASAAKTRRVSGVNRVEEETEVEAEAAIG